MVILDATFVSDNKDFTVADVTVEVYKMFVKNGSKVVRVFKKKDDLWWRIMSTEDYVINNSKSLDAFISTGLPYMTF